MIVSVRESIRNFTSRFLISKWMALLRNEPRTARPTETDDLTLVSDRITFSISTLFDADGRRIHSRESVMRRTILVDHRIH